MALIVETGSGSSTADSFGSLADAITYLNNRGDTTFSSASTADQEEAMRSAADYIVAKYATRWKGSRVYETQSLPWPRWGVVDFDNFEVPSNSVPLKVQYAQFELAKRAIAGPLMPDVTTPGGIKETERVVGPLKTRTAYTGASPIAYYPAVHGLLAPYLLPAALERA